MIERHPLEPFLPNGCKILMLGSFPPSQKRWSMNFFYPNFINDMWRIFGLAFFDDKDHFVDEANKTFKLDELKAFLTVKGVGLYD
ncbi:MAG: uracil-DNA glycosylase family protein, partial [Prevotella shahii]|nr:uracil-DNA glycosylase family protein [Hoylesella shahii]